MMLSYFVKDILIITYIKGGMPKDIPPFIRLYAYPITDSRRQAYTYSTAAIAFATTGRFLPFSAATLMRPEETA